jgi:hypothetical protein
MTQALEKAARHMEQRLKLSKYGRRLWTRTKAKQIRTEVIKLLDSLEVGGSLIIDAAGIDAFDYSFANEFFGKTLLALPIEYPSRFVVIENLSEYTEENLVHALEALNLAIIKRELGALKLLGKVHPVDEATFQAVVTAREAVSAAALKDALGVNLTTMNERLTKLAKLGVVRREWGASQAGREQYLYSTVV